MLWATVGCMYARSRATERSNVEEANVMSVPRATLSIAGLEESLTTDGVISAIAVSALLVAFAVCVVARYLAASA
jgi:hypothetical protein